MNKFVARFCNNYIDVREIVYLSEPWLNVSGHTIKCVITFKVIGSKSFDKFISNALKEHELKSHDNLKEYWSEYKTLLIMWKNYIESTNIDPKFVV